jgi:hypothetical protein
MEKHVGLNVGQFDNKMLKAVEIAEQYQVGETIKEIIKTSAKESLCNYHSM